MEANSTNGNSTPHNAREYDEQIYKTIPYYDLFHKETIEFIRTLNNDPEIWLDTGCGTGNLVLKAAGEFLKTKFILCDPSEEMTSVVKEKLSQSELMKNRISYGKVSGTAEIDFLDNTFDVITAIQCHHYLGMQGRLNALKNCLRMLKTGGIYITFENIRPMTQIGIEVGLRRMGEFWADCGKPQKVIDSQKKRFDNEYFPITIKEHIDALNEIGFSVVEVLWVSYMQAGFYCIK